MVQCKAYQMWNLSISELFGYTPKIKFICGKCDCYNEARIPIEAVRIERPYTKCTICGEINYIPIGIKEDYDE